MLHPDLKTFKFRGEETIYLNILKPTREITLHALELEIDRAAFLRLGSELVPLNIHFDAHAETITLVFARTLPAGKGELTLTFRGVLNDQLRGFYRSKYTHEGETKHLATTQLEATDARRAFPCFDEPNIKAVFDVTLMIPKGHTAISNTLPIKVTEHESGYQAVQFAPTPKMSTYLVACVVGEFEFIEGKSPEGVVVRVFTTHGKRHQAAFALDVACRALSFYTKYFGIPYPLPVLDLVAIPDFAALAMENWGAVTYRESAILIDTEHSSAADRQLVAIVVAHELAHQWFGNLVTMDWWTELWLNESFARYMEYVTLDNLFPEWDMWTQFTSDVLGRALRQDSLRNVQAVQTVVYHPSEIDEAFDPAISYSKGACIIRMLQTYIGERAFRAGLKYYFKQHAYGNATAEDLWRAFEFVSGKPIRKIMDYWVNTPGHPLLTVRRTQASRISLNQTRFFGSELERQKTKDKSKWQIPVALLPEKGTSTKSFFMSQVTTTLLVGSRPGWLKLNPGEAGFFQVDYPAGMLRDLLPAISGREFSPSDRLAIVRDAFALAESGQLPTVEALKVGEAYASETDYTVWLQVADNLEHLYRNIADRPYAKDLRSWARIIFVPLLARLGWTAKPGERHTITLLRALAIEQAGMYGDPAVIQEAKRQFTSLENTRAGSLTGFAESKIHPDLRRVVYKIAAASGGEEEHKIFMRQYSAAHLPEEKNRIGLALACFRQKQLLRKTLKFVLSDKVRRQDAPFIVAEVAANPAGGELVWEMVRREWAELSRRYGIGSLLLTRMIRPLAHLHERKVAREIGKFFRKNKSGAERTVAQVVERILGQDAWVRRDGKKIGEWLKKDRYR